MSFAEFFRRLRGNRCVKQQHYEPIGRVFGEGYREGGHSDHQHVASYDRGGILKPGMQLVYKPKSDPPEEVK